MSEVAIKKILNTVLINKFPGIKEVKVLEEDNEAYSPPRKEYIIWIGMTYSEMEKVDVEEVRSEARNLARYVVNFPKEIIRQIVFFDPYMY